MKIKTEYKGKTIVKNTTLGNITVVIDNIDVSKYKYYVSIGMGYIFEKESETIAYKGVEQETKPSDAKSKTKRTKRRVSPKVHGGLGESE
jgi:hypothetical protein